MDEPSAKPGLDPKDMGNLATNALQAAQQAVANLQSEAGVSAPAPASDDAALAAAQAAIAQAKALNSAGTPPLDSSKTARSVNMPEFAAPASAKMPEGISLLADVNLNVKIELGRTRMLVEDVLRLGAGSVVELDKLAGDPVDVYVNDRHVARGEVLVLNDNFCVRVNEIVANVQDLGRTR